MQGETDPVGNLHGVLQGSDPEAKSIVIGSHMDTVMQGGVYDGMLGVTGALEVAARLKDEGRTLRHPWRSGALIWKSPVFLAVHLEADA